MNDLPEDALEIAYRKMAIIVATHGEKYLLLFNRLHEEVIAQRAKLDMLSIARKIASEARK
jgi:hypothetical protein